MRQTLFRILAVSSLLIAIAAAVMWYRSMSTMDGYQVHERDGSIRLYMSYRGGVHVFDSRPSISVINAQRSTTRLTEAIPPGSNWRTRYGNVGDNVIWERAGFVLASGGKHILIQSNSTSPPLFEWLSTVGPATRSEAESNSAAAGSLTKVGVGTLTLSADTNSHQLLVIPYWPIVVLASLLPLWWSASLPAAIRRRLRRRRGQCLRCGYDLRGGHDLCPECGSPTQV